MSFKNKGLEIIHILGSAGQATRMEVFHAFDGQISWHNIKMVIMLLHSEGLIEPLPAFDPGLSKWTLTKIGKDLFLENFPEDAPTESVEV